MFQVPACGIIEEWNEEAALGADFSSIAWKT